MFDKLVAAGSTFDWITPLYTLMQDFRNRPSVGYNVPVDGGWSAFAISDLLKVHGIKLWGLTIFQETVMFRLRAGQAEYAQYLMEQNGIAYAGGVDTANARRHQSARRGAQPSRDSTWASSTPSKELPPNVSVRPTARRTLLSVSLDSINRFVDKLPGA